MKTIDTAASAGLARVKKTGWLMMAAASFSLSPVVQAQQAVAVADTSSTSTTSAQPVAPRRTMEEKAAVAAAILAAGFGAFKAMKAATQAPAGQALGAPMATAPTK